MEQTNAVNQKEIVVERLKNLLSSNGITLEELMSDDNTFWQDKLERAKSGRILPTFENHKLIFENSKEFKDAKIRFNEFTQKIEYNGEPMKNFTWASIRNAFDRAGVRAKDVVKDFVFSTAEDNKYNPIKEYLEALQWDGVPRVGTMFIEWFGVKDTAVVRKMTTKWMISAVKRIYEPGCSLEGIPILIGKQGCGKSVFINRLAKGYANESLTDLKDEKKCAEACGLAWIIHFDEVKALLKSDVETTKSFITKVSDNVRLAYREEAEEYPRHCIYFGSTNRIETGLLKDFSEGGEHERRFWMLECSDDIDKRNIYDNFTDEVVDQLWAEAYNIYKKNPNYNISTSDFTSEEIEEVINTQAEYKTYNNDDFKGVAEMILEREYSFCCVDNVFKDINDFMHQLQGDTFGDNKSKLDSIPMPWLHEALRKYDANRQTNYICSAFRGQWKLVRCTNYGNQRYDCFKRVKSEV